jgi:hypothetical protein
MKMRSLLTASLSIFLLGLQAQTVATVKRPADIFFVGHTIHLFKMSTGYGYDIYFQSRLLIHQQENPVTGNLTGLKSEDEAIKLAKWQVIHFRHYTVALTPEEKMISKSAAKQLNIAAN